MPYRTTPMSLAIVRWCVTECECDSIIDSRVRDASTTHHVHSQGPTIGDKDKKSGRIPLCGFRNILVRAEIADPAERRAGLPGQSPRLAEVSAANSDPQLHRTDFEHSCKASLFLSLSCIAMIGFLEAPACSAWTGHDTGTLFAALREDRNTNLV